MDYSTIYRDRLSTAFLESQKLGFVRPPIISAEARVDDHVLRTTSQLLTELSELFSIIIPGYWGNSCQALSANIFAHLNSRGIPANIVLGNVIINGTDEFDSTLEILQNEVRATHPLQGDQKVHAWVSVGGDTIIDAALPPRLVKYYRAPANFNDMIFVGRADDMLTRFKIEYQPLLVGTEFFAKTNPPDPMDLLNMMMRR